MPRRAQPRIDPEDRLDLGVEVRPQRAIISVLWVTVLLADDADDLVEEVDVARR